MVFAPSSLILTNYYLPLSEALAVQVNIMKLGIICTLGFSLVITLSGCSTQPASQFAQLDKETSDYCTQFNRVNASGKEITVNSYTIKSVETDSSGKKTETNKIVNCGA